ncbi:MAG: helix-turn-helix domain-containing protein [Hydrotalea sp.]|nr:helix-turn-helix domain-containing protein [Hydrotalea sp.]
MAKGKKIKSAKHPLDQFVINKVRNLRKEYSLSQFDLAVLLDTSPGFIGQVESEQHKSHYSISHLNQLAKIFRCSIKDFFPDKPF